MTTDQQTMPDADEILMGGVRVPTAKFTNPGDTVGGRIVAKPKSHPEREYDRNNPGQGKIKTFPSGDTIYGITVDVATNLRDPSIEDDDGVRRIYVEGQRMKACVRDAVMAAGETKLLPGAELYVTFTGFGVAAGPGVNPPKEYHAVYQPAAQAAVMGDASQQTTPQTAPQTAPAQQPPATPATQPQTGPPGWVQAPDGTWQQTATQQPPAAPAPVQQAAATIATPQGQVNPATGELTGPPPTPAQPTPEQVAAVRAAGVDPAAVFPGYTGG